MIKLSAIPSRSSAKKGTALLLTFIIMTTLTTVVMAFLYMSSLRLKGSGYDMSDSQALWLAEAGLQKALYTLKNDTNYQSSPTTITGSLGNGAYSVSAVKSGSIYTFTSLGTVNAMSRQIRASAAFTSSVLVRSIHADGSTVDFNGSTGVINGNISCHVHITNYAGMTINGTLSENFPMINPTLDFDYYKNLAAASGQLITGSYTFQNGTYSGVWYVTTGVTIGNNAIINGSIFSDSSIQFVDKADNVQITPSLLTNYPALAAKNNMSTSGTGAPGQRIGLQNSTINGLILAQNNITFDDVKNSTINGTILAGGNFSMGNGSGITINYNDNIFAPMPPAFTYSPGADLVVVFQKDWNEIVPAT
ncbi:MAG: hypothetical protein Q7J72_10420 [Candidatus Omnitrophota bacterium]|nr:hypothetical protein [Candidatus Omnitrophota bacterium]